MEVSGELAVVSLDDGFRRAPASTRSDTRPLHDAQVSVVVWRSLANDAPKHRRPTVMIDLPFVIYIK